MRWMPVAALIAITALAMPASAQVHRCKDASGKFTYSDRACDARESGDLIERQRTQSEIYQERLQAAEADYRKQVQRMAEQEREWAAQNQRAAQNQGAPVVRHSGNDWAKRKELENAATSASSITNNGGPWDKAAEERRKREWREQTTRQGVSNPPTNFSHCDSGFCYHNQGDVYHKAGPDVMIGPNGRTCNLASNTWFCN